MVALQPMKVDFFRNVLINEIKTRFHNKADIWFSLQLRRQYHIIIFIISTLEHMQHKAFYRQNVSNFRNDTQANNEESLSTGITHYIVTVQRPEWSANFPPHTVLLNPQ